MPVKVFTVGKGWRILAKALDPKVNQAVLQKYVGRATEANAIMVRQAVRENIRHGVGLQENAPLTALIKGGKRPIVGTPGLDLFNAITYAVQDWRVALVGVKRYAGETTNVAEIVHEGKTINVTKKMRGLFWVLWLASKGRIEFSDLEGRAKEIFEETKGAKGIKPLSKGTKKIVIPSRPFLKNTIEDDEVRARAKEKWLNAVKAAYAEMAT